LHGPGGAHLRGKGASDSESLARLPDGALLVAFERDHRIWRYPAGDNPLAGHPEALPVPEALRTLRSNSGIEALAILAPGEHGGECDGALLAIAEGRKEEAASPAFLWRDGAWSELTYPRIPGFRPTGATTLPGGDLLVIERSYNILDGVAIRFQQIPASQIRPGATLVGETLAVLRAPLTLDNLEGVTAHRTPSGETLVYLISDDNFNSFQRTLLLVFALGE
jgi:hypothetical protein